MKGIKILLFFHGILKSRRSKSRVEIIMDDAGSKYEGKAVNEQFVKHFEQFLGKIDNVASVDKRLFKKVLDCDEAKDMIGEVSDEEIKEAMFDIDNTKALGPDRFTSEFFKKAWKIVGNEVCLAIKEFFNNGKLPGEELLRWYNRKNGPKRCAMQIDIQKSYDTVSWSFLEEILGGRGLRQGDPISPYLFTLVMEVFSLIMEKNIEESRVFCYHFGCKELKLSHMCFADDLLVLCKGNIESIKVERDKLDLLQVMPLKCGKLSVRYLGVPLLAKKLGVSDYKDVLGIRKLQCGMINGALMDLSASLFLEEIYMKPGPSRVEVSPVLLEDNANVFNIHDKIEQLAERKGMKNFGNVVNKIILAATVYFVWQEGNLRMFIGESRSEEALLKSSMIMLKILAEGPASWQQQPFSKVVFVFHKEPLNSLLI
ncbi:RNA-directed DNA polymerase, eukaryota, reverse transcriptase zinc-binding domain protein [Tanacetum coccineum]